MKKIRTVCGDIAPEELGTTMIHEHVTIDLRDVVKGTRSVFPEVKDEQLTFENRNLQFLQHSAWTMSPDTMDVSGDDYVDFIVRELEDYKAVGGNSLCECSVYGMMGRPYEDLATISKKAGVHIINGVGMYQDFSRPAEFKDMGEVELKAQFDSVIDNGFGDSGVRPGFLKATFSGLTEDGLPLPGELDVYRACARISAERGMPLMMHVEAPPISGDILAELVKLAISLGVDPGKLLFCHMQGLISRPDGVPQTILDVVKNHGHRFSIESHKKLLDLGANLSFDCFGNMATLPFELAGMSQPDDYLKLSAVYELLELGYESQIMLGHDFCSKVSAKACGGYGYTRVPTFVRDTLGQLGYADAYERMVVQNPAEYLAF
ncbi:hypothetical protein [Gordonibacter massiliensis (ex Traore et al. 2017)]|uniref:phosphotriesterase family protein n=1 Tax=Gordonibacter massiliensis (ex Traore et al. 2017) TaxID=1841863 RepID=UPI001C8B121F|nr:hypothetical protein [Gordonibacter massiliensis (ex Traore et al. 2017)]MBX9032591.1 hypothetical protein [Gordonibacter massiliensis (ex Traore et al. 2017)]